MKLISRLFANQVICVIGQQAESVRGDVRGELLRDVSSVCERLGITDCEIWIDSNGCPTFSKEVPSKSHQRFRNVISVNRPD